MAHKKQYGLIIPDKGKNKVTAPPSKSSSSKPRNVFGDDSSGDEESNVDWVTQSLKKQSHGSMQQKASMKVMKDALKDDPSVYEYDEVYDDMTKKKEDSIAKKKGDKKPKYIESLLKTAKQRELENELRKEREAQRDREKEGDEFADKEAFVTSSFKKKMEELRKMEEDQAYTDAIDDATDVTKQKDMSGFYRQLYRDTMKTETPPETEDKDDPKPGSHKGKDNDHRSKEKDRDSTREERDEERIRAKDKEKESSRHRHPDTEDDKRRSHRDNDNRSKTDRDPDHNRDRAERDRERERTRDKDREFDRQNYRGTRKPEDDTKHRSRSHRDNDTKNKMDSRDHNRDRAHRDGERRREDKEVDRPRRLDTSKTAEDKDDSRHRRHRDIDNGKDKDNKRDRSERGERISDKNKEKSGPGDGDDVDSKVKIIPNENWYDFDVQIERDVKKSFYAKRTVGTVFDEALQRYLERKAVSQVVIYK